MEVVASDGGPYPLAEVRKLLPGGSGVLGRPPIVFTPTSLDLKPPPALKARPPTLVILSGNAGDGKTAFIMGVLAEAGINQVAGLNEFDIQER